MLTVIDDFLLQHDIADTTRARYRWYLVRVAAWLETQELSFETLTGSALMAWINSHDSWGNSSRRFCLNACRAFCRFTYGDLHPVLKARMKNEDPGPQRTLSPDECLKLLRFLQGPDELDTSNPKRVRDYALVSVLLDTGLRAAEVTSLKMENLDLAHQQLMVKQKGARWRAAIYSAETRVRLRIWLSVRERVAVPHLEEVFCGIGGSTRGRRMTASGLRVLFRRMAEQAGMQHFSPHSLRRAMACLSLVAGASTRMVARQGGWHDSKLVDIYSRQLPDLAFAQWLPTRQLAAAHAKG